VQPNAQDTGDYSQSYRKDFILMQNGQLTIRSQAGSNLASEGANDLASGLQMHHDSSSTPFFVQATVVGPFATGGWVAGAMWGKDMDNFARTAVHVAVDGSLTVSFDGEFGGASGLVWSDPFPSAPPAGTTSLELMVLGDPLTGQLRGAYSANGGALVMTGAYPQGGSSPAIIFDEMSRAGLFARSTNGGQQWVQFSHFVAGYGDPSVGDLMPSSQSPNMQTNFVKCSGSQCSAPPTTTSGSTTTSGPTTTMGSTTDGNNGGGGGSQSGDASSMMVGGAAMFAAVCVGFAL